jgi:hypothetical protein
MMIGLAAVLACLVLVKVALWDDRRAAKAWGGNPRPEVQENGCSRPNCPLCNPVLLGPFGSDLVVGDLEHRIETDTALVIRCLAQPGTPELVSQLYRA